MFQNSCYGQKSYIKFNKIYYTKVNKIYYTKVNKKYYTNITVNLTVKI